MGFGTLFIGYFLLLNVFNYGFTDAIAAAVMLMGLYKLARINREFKYSSYVCAGFLVFGIGELAVSAIRLFGVGLPENLNTYLAIPRYIIVAVLTVMFLRGIYEIAREVELERIPKRAKTLMLASFAVYAICAVLELVPLNGISALLFVAGILMQLTLLVFNLITIYTCYMYICMPGEENGRQPKPSRFGFVNEYRRRTEERNEREARERLERFKQKQQRKGGRKK